MKAPAHKATKSVDAETIRTLRHDIKNQLSNIHMAVEQLRYEIPDPSEDCKFYMDSIIMSSETINNLLTEIG
jgi:nitrogen-specific signal transduction histidine kinase